MNYRSIFDLSELIRKNLSLVPKDIDLIVGIPRSGLLVANLLSLYMNKPLMDLTGLKENRFISSGTTKNICDHKKNISECKKILVVEDSVLSGKSIDEAKLFIETCNIEAEFIYLAVYVEPTKQQKVDIFFEILELPRIFEWNIFHHQIITEACFDIDGVLCDDPTDEENDDGENYEYFLKNVKVKWNPSVKIGALVTSRLEKYRSSTEEWLKRNNIEYNELIMLDMTAEERRKTGIHAKHKADFYKKSKYKLFVESNPEQAQFIHSSTKKAVYCVDNNEFYDNSGIYKKKEQLSRKRTVLISILRKSKTISYLYYRIVKRERL